MTRLLIALTLALGLAGPASAQQDPAIEQVIRDQISAFQQDDFVAAFEHASPSIRQIFRSPDRFGMMVRNGYPMVWRPGELRFLQQRAEGGAVLQRLMIRDQDAQVHILEYQMIPTENGWKINGVQLLDAVGASA